MGTVAGLETDALPSLTVGLGDLRDYVQTGCHIPLWPGAEFGFRRAAGPSGPERW